jgi:hypothetical protein
LTARKGFSGAFRAQGLEHCAASGRFDFLSDLPGARSGGRAITDTRAFFPSLDRFNLRNGFQLFQAFTMQFAELV